MCSRIEFMLGFKMPPLIKISTHCNLPTFSEPLLLIIKSIKHAVNVSETIGGNCEFLVLTFNVRIALFTQPLPIYPSLYPKLGEQGGEVRRHGHIGSILEGREAQGEQTSKSVRASRWNGKIDHVSRLNNIPETTE